MIKLLLLLLSGAKLGKLLVTGGTMLLIVALLAAPQVWKALTYKKDSVEGQTYYAVSAAKKSAYGLIYLALTGFLAVMTYDVHAMLQALRAQP